MLSSSLVSPYIHLTFVFFFSPFSIGSLTFDYQAPPPHIRSSPSNHSLGLVTLDYRLAPQTRLPSILSDVAAGLAFLHSPAFHGATQGRLDVSKMIISGSSAGGWLALIAGWGVAFEACGLVKPEKPLAVCAIYPITGLEDPFWTTQQRRE